MRNCWIVVKQKRRTGKKGVGSVAKMCRTLEKGGVEKVGGSIANARRERVERSVVIVQGRDRSGMRWLPPKSPPGFDNTNDGEIVEHSARALLCRREEKRKEKKRKEKKRKEKKRKEKKRKEKKRKEKKRKEKKRERKEKKRKEKKRKEKKRKEKKRKEKKRKEKKRKEKKRKEKKRKEKKRKEKKRKEKKRKEKKRKEKKRKEKKRRKKKEERRTRRQKQVAFHNRTHKTFSYLCAWKPLTPMEGCRQQENTNFTATQVQERMIGMAIHFATLAVPL